MKIRILSITGVMVLLLACQISGNLSSAAPAPTAIPNIPQVTQTATITPEPSYPARPTPANSCIVSTGIDSGVVHVRSCPAATCPVTGYVYEGQTVTVETVKNGWGKIGNGWVYSQFLECAK